MLSDNYPVERTINFQSAATNKGFTLFQMVGDHEFKWEILNNVVMVFCGGHGILMWLWHFAMKNMTKYAVYQLIVCFMKETKNPPQINKNQIKPNRNNNNNNTQQNDVIGF